MMDVKKAEKYINGVKWQVSKTYAKTVPHEYTVREWQLDLEHDFEQFVRFIRQNGVTEKFYSKIHVYWYHGEHKYWTMGAPIDETTVINRCFIDDYYPGTNIYIGE